MIPTVQLDLRETDGWTTHALDRDVADLLTVSNLVEIRPVVVVTGRRRWEVRAAGMVGAAVLSGPGVQVDLRVAPKVAVARLLFLMSYAANAKGWRDELLDLPEAVTLPAAVGEALARVVASALRAGVLRGYRTVDAAEPAVRGRVRFADQQRRHFDQTLPVEVTYDEFTVDIAENQILRAALRRMLRVSGLPAATRRRLVVQLRRVGEVSDLVAGQVVPTWSPSRLNARYVPALRLAELVLRGASFDLSRGAVRASGFMVNMPTVFEDFVTVALGEALVGHSGGTAVLQDADWRLDEAGAVRLRPDLVWYPGPSGGGRKRGGAKGGGVRLGGRGGFGVPGVVVDAKYKAEKPSGFPNADIYQLLGYCTALGLTEGHLIYAKGNEDGCSYRIPAAEVTITAHTLDLEAAPRDLLGQVGALAGRILGQARSNAS